MKGTRSAPMKKEPPVTLEMPLRDRRPVRTAPCFDGEVYCSPIKVDLFPFDQPYLRRLQERDPVTAAHFASYFEDLVRNKLRKAGVPADDVDDLRQETLYRVLEKVQNGQIRQATALGAYVSSVCQNVLHEFWRQQQDRNRQDDLDGVEVPDPKPSPDRVIYAKERDKAVREVVRGLPAKERALIHAFFYLGHNKEELCIEFNVNRNYLRVCLHRAAMKFKQRYTARVARKRNRTARKRKTQEIR